MSSVRVEQRELLFRVVVYLLEHLTGLNFRCCCFFHGAGRCLKHGCAAYHSLDVFLIIIMSPHGCTLHNPSPPPVIIILLFCDFSHSFLFLTRRVSILYILSLVTCLSTTATYGIYESLVNFNSLAVLVIMFPTLLLIKWLLLCCK